MKKNKSKQKRTKLTRSKNEKIVFGVIAGVAEKYQIDPTLLRIAWLVCLAFTGFVPGIVVYLAAAVVMPSK